MKETEDNHIQTQEEEIKRLQIQVMEQQGMLSQQEQRMKETEDNLEQQKHLHTIEQQERSSKRPKERLPTLKEYDGR